MATAKGTTTLTLLALSLCAAPISAQEAALRGAAQLRAERPALGLDARHDFKAQRGFSDELGQTHTRFQQTFEGLKVWGGEVIVHQDAEGTLLPHTLAHRKGLQVAAQPALGASEALAVAHRDLAPKGAYTYAPTAELVIFPVTHRIPVRPSRLSDREDEGREREVVRHHLAYHVHTELENGAEETRHTDYMVDARNGAILARWNSLRTGSATGTGKSQWYGTVNLDTNSTATGYELRDMTRGTGGTFGNNVTTNLNHGTSGNGTIYSDADNAWGDGNAYGSGTTTSTTGPTGQTAAVDAHHGLHRTWDMFKNVFGRNGIDNTGKATYSRMHYSSNYDNAFWSDSCFCMTYGDGNPPSGSYGEADLDTAGHEMTHGVCAATANLTYSGESGGLNESNSDIFGTCVEFYTLGAGGAGSVVPDATGSGAITANYTLFENSWGHPGQALRYMYRPDLDGSSPNYWYSGMGSLDVHYSSGPMNRCFYFLAKGATTSGDTSTAINTPRTGVSDANFLPAGMTGIGNDKAARIWYRALTAYLTSSSTYANARSAAISAAKDLYGAGSAEEAAVWNAFRGINVGSAWSGGGGGGDTTAPTCSASESGTSGTITLSATASDNVGVTKVEFYVDGSLKGTDTTSPYSMTLDSTTLADGSHTLVAKAYDAAGNAGSSSSVAFSVSNGGGGTGTEKIVNGGFESGATGWTQTSGVIGTYTAQPAHGGAYNAWMCGYGSTKAEYVYQQVAIPSTATSATLSFWMHIDTAETTTSTAYDKFYIQVLNTSGSVLKTFATYSNLNKNTGYVQKSFDLSAYKGKTIRVRFRGTEDSSLQTSFVVDDVSVLVK